MSGVQQESVPGGLCEEELACIYSAAILADDDVPVTQEKLTTILKAADVQVEPIWPMLYARALSGVNIRELITSMTSSAMAPAPGGTTTATGTGSAGAEQEEDKQEEKKPDTESDSDEDMGFGLFD